MEANPSESQLYVYDYNLFLIINESHYSSYLNQFMIWMTLYGKEMFWLVTIILMFTLGGWIGKKVAVIMVICMIVLIPIGFLTKDIVKRQRPLIPKEDFILQIDAEYAFPSGHAMIVSANAAVALALFRITRKQRIITMILALEAALVCISRIYVGGHYPSDVVGGVLLGVGISFIIISLQNNLETKIMIPMKKNIQRK
ncbi:MAG: phosphatase PAP2 family protein [Nitrososphaeraceae archaeon]|jgi:membrane-associated phospholipid phosphatase